MRKKVFGTCHLCGEQNVKLSFEHVPPEAAFNDRRVFYTDIHSLILADGIGDPRMAKRHQSQKGAGRHTLCEQCNNNTGSWYGTAYVEWVYQGMLVRNMAPKGSSLLLPFHIFPGRVAKQIICMFASSSGPGLCEKSPDLRRYIMNRDYRGIPDKFRLYGYMIAPDSTATRQSGIVGMIADLRTNHTFSEIAFPPFGYILAIDSEPPDRGLLDLTYLTEFGYKDWRAGLHLKVPMRAVNSYFPSDFRTADEWTATLDRAHGSLVPSPDLA